MEYYKECAELDRCHALDVYWENKEFEKGLFYTRRAADHGDRDAQYNLGCLYEEGTAVEKDLGKAIYWFDQAAKQNHNLAIAKMQNLNRDVCVVPFTVEYVDKVIEYDKQLRIEKRDLTKLMDCGIFSLVNVPEKLVKPLVRRAPEGAFRYLWRH